MTPSDFQAEVEELREARAFAVRAQLGVYAAGSVALAGLAWLGWWLCG